jgi:hypothetical protein
VKGQDNFVYVRVRNRGGSAAVGVLADVYWAPSAALVTPDLWTPIGTATIAQVPAGDVLTVSPAITWPAAKLPAVGAYAFVAVLRGAADPPLHTVGLEDWDTFVDLVRRNGKVAWRNFNVVSIQPIQSGLAAGFVALDFIAPGPPDRARPMRLEVIGRLPTGSRALLEMSRALYAALPERVPSKRGGGESVRVPVNPHGTRLLGEILFPAKSRSKLRLLVQVPKRAWKMPCEIAARQVYEGMEVGRVTWRLVPPARPRV